jgi:hypothetical protein
MWVVVVGDKKDERITKHLVWKNEEEEVVVLRDMDLIHANDDTSKNDSTTLRLCVGL